MANDLTLLGALVATRNLTVSDAEKLADFCKHVDDVNVDVPDLYAGIDLALGFFNDDPNAEAQKTAEKVQAAHDAATCPDCGGPVDDMDDDDYDFAFSLYYTVRNMIDKRFFEYVHVPLGDDGPDLEEC